MVDPAPFLSILLCAATGVIGCAGQLAGEAALLPDRRVERALEALGLDYQVDDDDDFALVYEDSGESASVPVIDVPKRTQVVYVFSRTEQYGEVEIREVWSAVMITGELSARIANRLLEANDRVKLGAFRTSRIEGGEDDGKIMLAFAAHISADADPETLEAALEMVFAQADEMEAELTQADEF